MKGLLLKDFYMIMKYCRAFVFIIFGFLLFTFFDHDNTFFLFYPIVIGGLIPVTLISYDEREKWDIYSGTLPYTKSQLVSSKYIVGLIFGMIIFVISSVIQALNMINSNAFTLKNYLPLISMLLIVSLIGPSFLFPFIFKLGAEKGRIAYYIVIATLCASITVFAGSSFMVPEKFQDSIIYLAVAATIILYIFSWRLSILLYKKRAS